MGNFVRENMKASFFFSDDVEMIWWNLRCCRIFNKDRRIDKIDGGKFNAKERIMDQTPSGENGEISIHTSLDMYG